MRQRYGVTPDSTIPNVQLIGHISTEGGPLLLVDLDAVGNWHGAFASGEDYERLCRMLDIHDAAGVGSVHTGVALDVAGRRGVAWDMPTGTADLWRVARDELLLSRPWLTREGDGRNLAAQPMRVPSPIGEVDVVSGWLVILWAAEDGADIGTSQPADGLRLDLSVGGSGVVAALPTGSYRCLCDQIEEDGERSVRLKIAPSQ